MLKGRCVYVCVSVCTWVCVLCTLREGKTTSAAAATVHLAAVYSGTGITRRTRPSR
jgi:hypothetical protein